MQDVFFNIIYMAVLANIELTLCWYRINTCSVSIYIPFTLSTSQYWPPSNRHCVYIVCLISCLHRRHWSTLSRYRVYILLFFLFHRRHCQCNNVDQHRIDNVSTTCVDPLSCLHRRQCRHRNIDRQKVNIVAKSYLFIVYGVIVKEISAKIYVNNVNSTSVQHRNHWDVDNVNDDNVKEISTMSTI